ncbi:hypothetical protein BJ742DRAFT_65378 [Cladochytrium replicatum]|nr:hypothetical protein BJ742DRAFT_65378 [Cladochytrium replicatum]
MSDSRASIPSPLTIGEPQTVNHRPSADSAMSGTVASGSPSSSSVPTSPSESMPAESNQSSSTDPASAPPTDRLFPTRRSSLLAQVDSPHQPTFSSFRSSFLSTTPILTLPLDDVHHHPLQLDTDSDDTSDAITAIPVSRLRSTSDASAPTSPPIPVPSRRQSHALYDTIASDRHVRRASSLNTITTNSTASRHSKVLPDAPSTIPPPSPQDSKIPTVASPSSSHLSPLDPSRPLSLFSTTRGGGFSPERSTLSEFPNPAIFKPRSMSSASRDDHVDNPIAEMESETMDSVTGNGTPPTENQSWTLANKKRNTEFHEIFTKLPKEDHLIEDFACNLQKEPPAQGRLYVSERHICFSTKILWVQAHQVSIPFPEVLTLEKRNGPSGTIEISTISTKFTFSGFVNRDSVYDMLQTIWTPMGPKQNIKLTTFRKSVVPSKRSTSPAPSMTRGGSTTPAPSIGSTTLSTKSKSSSKKCSHVEDGVCEVCAIAGGTDEDGMVSESSVLVDSGSLSDTSSSQDTTEIRHDELDDDDDTKNEVEAYIYETVKNELTQAAKLEEEEQMQQRDVKVVKTDVVVEEKVEDAEAAKKLDERVKVEEEDDVHTDTQSEQQLTVTAASVDRVKAAEKKLTNRLSAGSLASLFTGMSTNSLLSNTSSGSSGTARNVGGLVGDAIEGPSAGASPVSTSKPDPTASVRNFLASLGMPQVGANGNGSGGEGKASPPKSPATTKMPSLVIGSPVSKKPTPAPTISQPNSNAGSTTTTSASGGEEGTPERARSIVAAEAPPLGLAEIAAAVVAGSGSPSPVGIGNPSDGGYDTDNSLVITTTVPAHPHIVHQPHPVRRGSAASVLGSPTRAGTKHGVGEEDAEAKKKRKKRKAKVGRIVATGKCGCEDTHKKMVGVMDATVQCSMEAVWALLFGDRPLVGSFYRSFLEKRKIKDTKSTTWVDPSTGPPDSALTDMPEGPEKDHQYLGSLSVGSVRREEYLMPVSNPIGPKAVICKVREELLKYVQGNNVCVLGSSQTPDAPSGSSFVINVRCCMISDPGSNGKATRLKVSCEVEWLKGSWLKLAVDQAAPQGIRSHQQDLHNFLKAYLTTQGPTVEVRVAKHLPAIAEETETDEEDDDGTGLGVGDPSASLRVGTQLLRTKDPLFHPLAEEVERLGKHARRNEDDGGVEDEVEALLQDGVMRRGRWGLRRSNTWKGSNAPTRSSSLGRPSTPTSPTTGGRVRVGGGGGGWEAVGVWVMIVVVIVVLCGVMWMMVWMGMLVVKMEERMRVLEGLVREQTGLMRGMVVGGGRIGQGELE